MVFKSRELMQYFLSFEKAYQTPRDSVFAVINKNYWSYISIMAQTFPTFVYPLPRDNNQWFFYVGQWGGNEINFTSLEHYKLNGPDAPVLLSMCHYPDLLGLYDINYRGV